MTESWTVPRDWPGETAVCIGGGPSLSGLQVLRVCRARFGGSCRVIAINNAYRIAPWADVLYACDARWWKWHKGAPAFAGLKVTQDARVPPLYPDVLHIKPTGIKGFDPDPSGIRTGKVGGYQAVHIAAHFGARRIVLLGFDMKADSGGRCHWHDEHETPSSPQAYPLFLKGWSALAEALSELGIEVLNCTPGSALDVFPMAELEEVL